MAIHKYVRILDAALDEGDKDSIILRGRIDPHTLDAIQFDDYQREILPRSTINKLIKAFETGSVPDVELGMRGHKTRSDATSYVLLDPTYAVDGQQRIQAAKLFMQQNPDKLPHLGATIHFGTNYQWEKRRFHILGTGQTKVSPNVLLRNHRDECAAIQVLYALTSDKSFTLFDRVCWNQRKLRSHLLTALMVCKAVGYVHGHIAPCRTFSVTIIPGQLQRLMDKIGKNTFRDNVKTFFQAIDDCWGIRTVTYDGAPHLRNAFLLCAARLFSNHATFWRGNKLFIEMNLLRKLKLFPVHDPQVAKLCSGGGQSVGILYNLLIDHMNRGKTSKRLVARKPVDDEPEDTEDE